MDATSILSQEEERKAKRRSYNKAYYEAHKESLQQYAREYYWQHTEAVLQKASVYKEKHHEKLLHYARIYHYKHREKRLQYIKEWRVNNRDKRRQYAQEYVRSHYEEEKARKKKYRQRTSEYRAFMYKKWCEQHRDKIRIYSKVNNKRRRARKNGAARNDLTLRQWRSILRLFHYCCAYCQKKFSAATLEQDHIQPLTKGGSHTVWNVVPACRHCNATKHTGPPLVPVQPLLLVP